MNKFLSLGGADEIGASCFYFNIDGTGILLDCGIHPQKTGAESLPMFNLLENKPLDFAFISHAHQDHIGALPFLIKKYPHVKIFATPQSIDIAKLTLHNTVNFLSRQLSLDDGITAYTHEEIDMLLRSVNTADYNEEIFLKGIRHETAEEIKISFHDAGHILGSAGILIEYNNDKTFYTGDISLLPQTLMAGASLPGKKIDSLIMESTYAGSNQELLGTLASETKRFTKSANKILSEGGSILIPVFALGKMQEVLANIFIQMENGKLTETNIYTAGLGRSISHIYDLNRYIVKYSDKEFELKNIPQQNYFEINDLNHFKRHPGIVLASSGMILKDTSSYRFAEYWLKQEKFAVFIVGYMDPDTMGYKIANAGTGSKITFGDEEIIIRCGIERFYFPTHSKRNELVTIVKKLNPKRVVIVHGEPAAHDWMGNRILTEFPHMQVFSAEKGKEILL